MYKCTWNETDSNENTKTVVFSLSALKTNIFFSDVVLAVTVYEVNRKNQNVLKPSEKGMAGIRGAKPF